MNTVITELVLEAEGRYLRSDELKTLQTYVEALPRRITLYRSLQSQEDAVVKRVIAQYRPLRPDLVRRHGQAAWQKCERDLRSLWRYCCMAMVLEDESYLQNKLLYWMETILKAHRMKSECKPAYQILMDTLPVVLSEPEAEAIRPYLITARMILVD